MSDEVQPFDAERIQRIFDDGGQALGIGVIHLLGGSAVARQIQRDDLPSFGQRGLRVQAISNELGGERVEVIQYDEKAEEFVKNALSPSPVIRVDIVVDEKTAYVVVPDRYLSLAIGKEGQNARLAAKLTGWRIDIRSESEVRAEAEPEPEPEPVVVEAEAAAPAVEEDQEAIRHDLVAEVEAESLAADEDELEDEDRALLGGKKKKDRR